MRRLLPPAYFGCDEMLEKVELRLGAEPLSTAIVAMENSGSDKSMFNGGRSAIVIDKTANNVTPACVVISRAPSRGRRDNSELSS